MRKLVSMLLAVLLCLSLTATALAEVAEVPETGQEVGGEPEGPQVEQTKWFYRVTDEGLLQKRLWSWTYMKWLTDWITIGEVA